MKLITLNTWGGRVIDPLAESISRWSKDTDIFCLQEICHKDPKVDKGARANIFSEIAALLPGFNGFFRPFVDDHFGLAAFVKKSVRLEREGDVFVYKERGYVRDESGNEARNIQYLVVSIGGKKVTIVNFHGLWNGKGKTDTEDRLSQSRRIVEFAKTVEGPMILCGDFNLLPDTQSIKILEGIGMRNLVIEHGVTSTRTSLYTRGATSGHFADYILCTPGVKVNEFKVLPDVVSDHAALFLDFDIA